MPISEKIKKQIVNLKENDNFKALMLNVLEQEDKGNHWYKEIYEKMINDYLKSEEGNEK